ncbi:MAG: NAD(P)/FAD-dependent oxidoreductase [Elusimicrobiota bacterium]
MTSHPIVIIGGGAAGFFAAIACAEKKPQCSVILLEQGRQVLAKVKISGGGRCNLTHSCFDPKTLTGFYPRGGKELLGPFHHFQPKDTVHWFEQRGVPLKTEPDGRMFPLSNTSQTIIDALENAARSAGVCIRTNVNITDLIFNDDKFTVLIENNEAISASKVLLATGSGRRGFQWAAKLGHTIESPVPSLFTFLVPDTRLRGLEGISMPNAEVTLIGTKIKQTGPLLITHQGLSGPAILKLSAWGARAFHEKKYQTQIKINWVNEKPEKVEQKLRELKEELARKFLFSAPLFEMPRRLWERILFSAGILESQTWANLSREQMLKIIDQLTNAIYKVTGQNSFKEEFVTCGGVRLDEVNFKTMESRRCPGLYFAGEILDIDAVTGGFNFQNAWTTGWIAGQALSILKEK